MKAVRLWAVACCRRRLDDSMLAIILLEFFLILAPQPATVARTFPPGKHEIPDLSKTLGCLIGFSKCTLPYNIVHY